MITPSRTFYHYRPWWTMLLLSGAAFLIVGMAALTVWGWMELRFSPVQRHYLSLYMEATVGALKSYEPEHVDWIEKRAPNKPWEIAQSEDLAPAQEEGALFELSPLARSQGWTELGYDSKGMYTQQGIRDYLEANFYGGHSLLFLVLQPFELAAVGWLFWMLFERWRNNLARKRGLHWNPHYRPNTLNQDLRLFIEQISQEGRDITVQVRRWVTPRPRGLASQTVFAGEGAAVSPSQAERAMPSVPAATRPEPASMIATKAVEATPLPPLQQAGSTTKPNQSILAESQPMEPQPEPKSAPKSPFGKPVTDGETERKWDMSEWID